jgi:hypothetical protein
MSKRIMVKGWQLELDWQGMTLTPPEQVDRYREIKPTAPPAWMQAADAFVPGGLLLADVPAQRQRERETKRRRAPRRRIS